MSHTVRLDASDQESDSFDEESLPQVQIEDQLYYILNEMLVTEGGDNIATVLEKVLHELTSLRVALEKVVTAAVQKK